MKYKINELVYVENNRKQKIIVDYENVAGVNIYYMSDKTSYCEEQINKLYCEYHELDYFIINNEEKILRLFDTEKLASQLCDFYKNSKKQKKRGFN